MKKILLSLLMATSLVACGEKTETPKENEKPVVKIGATLPLSGDLAYIGVGVKNALNMLMEKWQQKDTKYNYQIVFEDDKVKSQQAVLNANKFINIDKANVVVSVFGVVDIPVDNVANTNKVISLSCSYGKNKLPKYGFNTSPQNEEIYIALVQELKKRNVKSVALVGSNATVSNILLGYAAENLPKDGIEVIFDERYNVGETDYRLSIQKMEQKTPDYYIVFGVEPMNSIFVRQYYELSGKNNVTSMGAFPNISTKVFPAINGIWSVYVVGNSDDFEKTYIEKYQNRVEACSANLYDGLDMIINAFENTAPNENETIPDNADVLQKIRDFKVWDGASGKMKIEPNGCVRMDVPVRMYQNGKWVKIEE